MKQIEAIMNDIEKLHDLKIRDLADEIICTFEDYEFDGEDSVIVSQLSDGELNAYIDHPESPVISVTYEMDEDDETVTVTDVYIAR